jgi:hypothetical protein
MDRQHLLRFGSLLTVIPVMPKDLADRAVVVEIKRKTPARTAQICGRPSILRNHPVSAALQQV